LYLPLSASSPFRYGGGRWAADNLNAVVQMLDTGHFALETHVDEIAVAIHVLLAKVSA
jgi:hypothetical protein